MTKTRSTTHYVTVFVGLLVLTTTSLLLSFVTRGVPGIAVAYVIALVKGSIVAWFFMHLSEETWSSRLTMTTAFLLVLLLVGLVLGDIVRRPNLQVQVPIVRR